MTLLLGFGIFFMGILSGILLAVIFLAEMFKRSSL